MTDREGDLKDETFSSLYQNKRLVEASDRVTDHVSTTSFSDWSTYLLKYGLGRSDGDFRPQKFFYVYCRLFNRQ